MKIKNIVLFVLLFSTSSILFGEQSPFDLSKAILSTELEEARSIIESGVDINSKQWNGSTLLSFIAMYGTPYQIGFVLENGGKNINDAFRTAIVNEKLDNATFLIKKGAEIDSEDKYGKSAIFMSVQMDKYNVTKELIELGAKKRLYHQVAFCPAKNPNKTIRLFLGDLLNDCQCPEKSKIRTECGEGQSVNWCESNGKRNGYEVFGSADCFGDQPVPYKVHRVRIYKNDREIKKLSW